MILRDKITTITSGGTDNRGNPLPSVESGPYPAQVDPIRSDESVRYGSTPVVLYYRLIIGPTHGAKLTTKSQVKWRGRTLAVQGDVEPWMVNGRLHHYEATLKAG
ncbi:hypothetical protein [Micrococcus terreus]|uniref:hypothetical protein n=1 Tax=Micrococcus terreus TaxID=574650 RepID=UPI0030161DE0